jgi:hypothetical protein
VRRLAAGTSKCVAAIAALIAARAVIACNGDGSSEVACIASRAVYGVDGRENVANAGEPWATLASRMVAQVPNADFDAVAGKPEAFAEYSATRRRLFCTEERFSSEPSLADCSGILLAPDLVLTAGHCLTRYTCDTHVYVRGFLASDDGASPLARDQARHCRRIELIEGGDAGDYAFLRLDAPFDSPPVMPVRAIPPEQGTPVFLFGFSLGLPLKLRSANVVSVARDGASFASDADAFAGDSGGGVFDESGTLLGLILRGQTDLDWDAEGACFHMHHVVADPSLGLDEIAAAVGPPLERACDEGIVEACDALRAQSAPRVRSECP